MLLHGVERAADGQVVCDCKAGGDCVDAGKHPRFNEWQRRASKNLMVLLPTLDRFPAANVGIATGPRSGIVVIDLDPGHGSEEAVKRLAAEVVRLPDTVLAETGGGGSHLYHAWPVGYAVGNALPAVMVKDGVERRYPGIDVRGRGGYVVAPPSRHRSGGMYSWARDLEVPMASLPPALLVSVRREIDGTAPPEGLSAWEWAALTREVQAIADTEAGERNNTVFGAACRLGEIIAGGGLDEDTVTDWLVDAAVARGLRFKDVQATVRSGLQTGAATPRRIKPEIRNRQDALDLLGEIRIAACTVPRKGHQGKRMRAVLEGLIRMGMRAGGPVFTAGHRRISLEVGLSTKPVTRALHELIDEGWAVCLDVGRDGRSSTWRLRLPPGMPQPDPADSRSRSDDVATRHCEGGDVGTSRHPSLPIGHDLFRGGTAALDRSSPDIHIGKGLDKTGWAIVEHLNTLHEPITQAALARTTGLHRSTISRHLARLIQHGLVTRDRSGLTAPHLSKADLDRIARSLGTDGASALQRQRFGWVDLRDTPDEPLPESTPCPHRPSPAHAARLHAILAPAAEAAGHPDHPAAVGPSSQEPTMQEFD